MATSEATTSPFLASLDGTLIATTFGPDTTAFETEVELNDIIRYHVNNVGEYGTLRARKSALLCMRQIMEAWRQIVAAPTAQEPFHVSTVASFEEAAMIAVGSRAAIARTVQQEVAGCFTSPLKATKEIASLRVILADILQAASKVYLLLNAEIDEQVAFLEHEGTIHKYRSPAAVSKKRKAKSDGQGPLSDFGFGVASDQPSSSPSVSKSGSSPADVDQKTLEGMSARPRTDSAGGNWFGWKPVNATPIGGPPRETAEGSSVDQDDVLAFQVASPNTAPAQNAPSTPAEQQHSNIDRKYMPWMADEEVSICKIVAAGRGKTSWHGVANALNAQYRNQTWTDPNTGVVMQRGQRTGNSVRQHGGAMWVRKQVIALVEKDESADPTAVDWHQSYLDMKAKEAADNEDTAEKTSESASDGSSGVDDEDPLGDLEEMGRRVEAGELSSGSEIDGQIEDDGLRRELVEDEEDVIVGRYRSIRRGD
ncbi:hypothetical protein LTR53_004616 [Teratosphaeriaceae sp. CCFEE 6253]|nr:hypothetical protein LTR53_004616 [Teratosphaeriaceae sp. CCFEE 6253]